MTSETRFCNRCQTSKALSEFSKSKYTSYGFSSQCKLCNSNRSKAWALENKARINARQKARRDFKLANPEIFGEQMEVGRLKNLATAKARRERRKVTEPEVLKAERRRDFERSREAIKVQLKEKRKTDVNFKIRCNMGNRLYAAVKRYKNNRTWQQFVDYSVDDLKAHLASQFTEGMTWDNYGEWHIDHVRPVSSFDFTVDTDSVIKQCWALSNLQPLWALDNIRKNNRWDGQNANS